MLSRQSHIEQLVDWMQTFDPSHLQNEDDVETKFVLPFFHHLGYPERYRRGKYPVPEYQSGKPGRKKEADQVYFSVAEPEKQNEDTALVLVEAKNTQESNLDDAVIQAQAYGDRIKPLFLVVTNGQRLKVLKRHRHHSDEVVFDITTPELRDISIATAVYDQLQFETVKRVKEQTIDPLVHAQYVEVMQTLDHYPDIEAQLAKGDFPPSTTQEGRRLVVVKPKVAITCQLPVAFEEGNCRIEFSNIMLRGLTCHLSHAEILTDFFIGLGTSPSWETRCFLHKTEQHTFEARLGQTTIILSEDEASQLCDAVDEVCQKYKDILIKTTNVLETWDFRPVTMEGSKGFELLTVEQWLWDLMKQFSQEFDYDEGNSAWHIFDSHSWGIRVSQKNGSAHVIIGPKFGGGFFPSNEVDLLYVDCITYLHLYEDTTDDSIFQNVGPSGVWTATYTKEWIKQQFIPTVLSYYNINQSPRKRTKKELIEQVVLKVLPFSTLRRKKRAAIAREAVQDYSSHNDVPLADITEPKQFAPYLHQIQSLFLGYHTYGTSMVPATLLRPYYAAFTELARCADLTTVDLHYIRENLGGVGLRTLQVEDLESRLRLSTYSDIMNFLDEQVARIRAVNSEYHRVADLLSRTFIAIVENGTLHFTQSQLNAAKTALGPLWEDCRFDHHFIEPVIFPSVF